MNAIFTVSILLIAVAALGTHSAAIPKRHRCNCIQYAPNSKCTGIKPNMVKRIERLPAGTFCNKEEVIIHFKKGKTLCVDPMAESVKKLEMVLKSIQLRAAATVNISTTSTPETTTTDS